MKLSHVLGMFIATPLALLANTAFADDPCGNFDITSGLDCEIQVEGGCTANCTPLKFEAGCTGQCTGMSTTTCTDDCGIQCVAQCDPAALDCFTGCHAECDQPIIDKCNTDKPGEDCVNIAKAQCDIHCNDACKVPDTNCSEHCNACCTGSCTTVSNFDCDYDCFAKLEGGCTVQCDAPSGALFCNGQYVDAGDVQACIDFLATQGIEVDVSAQGEVTCDLSGCNGEGSANAGICSFSEGSSEAAFGGGAALFAAALGLSVYRRRRSTKTTKP